MNFSDLEKRLKSEVDHKVIGEFTDAAWGALRPLFEKYGMLGYQDLSSPITDAVQKAGAHAASVTLRRVSSKAQDAAIAVVKEAIKAAEG